MCGCPVFPTTLAEKTIFSPLYILASFMVKDELTIDVWFISGTSVLFHQCICLFLCQYHAVLITIALQYCLKSRRVMPPHCSFSSTILGLLWFHDKSSNYLFHFCEKVKSVSIWIVLNVQTVSDIMATLTILILPKQNNGRKK